MSVDSIVEWDLAFELIVEVRYFLDIQQLRMRLEALYN